MSLLARIFGGPTPPAGPPTLPVDPTYGDPEAARILAAVRARSWPDVRDVLAASPDAEHLVLLLDVAAEADGPQEWLPDVLRAEPDATLASLLYGARLAKWAWEARTGMRAKYVSRDRFELFFERLRMAEDCLQGVTRREPDSAAAWHWLLITARGLQLGVQEARRRFDRAVANHPGHVWAHHQMLQIVCAKWSGSHEQMHDFARTAMMGAPPGSPLGHLVAIAHIEQSIDKATTVRDMRRYFRAAGVRAELDQAADRSVRHPDYRRGPVWATVHTPFAIAFGLAGEHQAAGLEFRALGDIVVEWPWNYVGDEPGRAFCDLRREVYRKAGRSL